MKGKKKKSAKKLIKNKSDTTSSGDSEDDPDEDGRHNLTSNSAGDNSDNGGSDEDDLEKQDSDANKGINKNPTRVTRANDVNDKDETQVKNSSIPESVIRCPSPSSDIHPAAPASVPDILMNDTGWYIFFVLLFQAYSR
jgi:hypothetical protein